MDFPSLDEKMELASSPFQHVDDLDLEFDQMEQRDTLTTDNTMDDATEEIKEPFIEYQDDDIDILDDEELGEYDTKEIEQEQQNEHEMDESFLQHQQDDEEILYDEVDDSSLQEASNVPQQVEDVSNRNVAHDDNATPIQPDHADDVQPPTAAVDTQIEPPGEPVGEANDPSIEDRVVDPQETEIGPDPDQPQIEAMHERNQAHEHFEEDVLDFAAEEPVDQQYANIETTETVEDSHGQVELYETDSIGQQSSLHPVKVVYLGEEMSLFPPQAEQDTPTFFLNDTSLIYESLDVLLQACRQVLSDSIGHDDELVLDVPTLGLHICEDSKYASQITLSQVLEVFLKLNHNENIQDVEPFYCNLSTRVCLATQYAYLSSSAQEGKMFSEIVAEHVDSPIEDEVEPGDQVDVEEDNHQEDVGGEQEVHYFAEAADDVEESRYEDVEESRDAKQEHEFSTADGSGTLDRQDVTGPDHLDGLVSEAQDVAQERSKDPTLTSNDVVEAQETLETDDYDPQNNADQAASVGVPDEDSYEPAEVEAAADTVETGSSHTAEYEPEPTFHDEARNQDESDQFYQDENTVAAGFRQTDSEAGVIAQEPIYHADNLEEELDAYNDEELLPKDVDNLDEIDIGEFYDDEPDQAQTKEEENFTAHGASHTNGKHSNGDQQEVAASHVDATVSTPMKTRSAKRKAPEDDDEIDLFLNDTPEPKRRRPTP